MLLLPRRRLRVWILLRCSPFVAAHGGTQRRDMRLPAFLHATPSARFADRPRHGAAAARRFPAAIITFRWLCQAFQLPDMATEKEYTIAPLRYMSFLSARRWCAVCMRMVVRVVVVRSVGCARAT